MFNQSSYRILTYYRCLKGIGSPRHLALSAGDFHLQAVPLQDSWVRKLPRLGQRDALVKQKSTVFILGWYQKPHPLEQSKELDYEG